MKLLIVTAIAAHQQDVLKLFKASGSESFSSSEIDGYKNITSIIAAQIWSPSKTVAAEDLLFYSYSKEEKVKKLLETAHNFSANDEIFNPNRATMIEIKKLIKKLFILPDFFFI